MRDVRKAYYEAKTVLLTVLPFAASLLNKARVVVTEAVPTAAVDRKNSILINPKFFMALKPEERVFVLAHEAFHWAFLDVQRVGSRNHKVWNIVVDGVNNNALLEVLNPGRLQEGMITLNTLAQLTGKSTSELKEMSKEKIYELLEQQMQGGSGGKNGEGDKGERQSCPGSNLSKDSIGNDLRNDIEGEGEVIQEGSKELRDRRGQELEEAMKRAIAEAEHMQKLRGTMPAGLARLVNAILRPKVPWKTLLKQALRDGLGRTTTQSWKRLSRRHSSYPGKRRLTTPTVWVGVDTSGSISPQELEQFIGEVYSIARQFRAKVVVIPWDARMYDPITITSAGQIRQVTAGLRGGGGTDPTEFLKYVAKYMRPLDAVVILSDGYIGRPEYYLDDVRPVTAKASVSIFVSTGAEVRWPGWKFIKIE